MLFAVTAAVVNIQRTALPRDDTVPAFVREPLHAVYHCGGRKHCLITEVSRGTQFIPWRTLPAFA